MQLTKLRDGEEKLWLIQGKDDKEEEGGGRRRTSQGIKNRTIPRCEEKLQSKLYMFFSVTACSGLENCGNSTMMPRLIVHFLAFALVEYL